MSQTPRPDAEDKSFIETAPVWTQAILLFAASLLVFTLFNWDRELLRLECRFLVFVRELAAGGQIGLFPTLYGEPYADYPSTFVVIAHALSKLFGSISTFALTLPVSLSVATAVAITYLTGAEHSKRLGLVAGLLLLCTYGFINGGRSISMDAFVCLGAACSFRFSQLSCLRPGVWSALHFIFGLCAVAFAFAFRGPLGAVVASAAFIAWPLGGFQWRRTILAACACGAVFAALLAGLLGLAFLQGGQELYSAALHSQVGGRLSGSGKPVWLYFTNGLAEFAIAFPLALLALFLARKTVWRKGRGPEIDLFGRFMLWGLLVVIGLTVPSTRHLRYILPAMPAFALAAACLWAWPEAFALPEKLRAILRGLTPGRLAVAAAALGLLWISVVETLEAKAQTSRGYVREIERRLPSNGGYAFFGLGPDGEELKFLCNSKSFFRPLFIAKSEELAACAVPVVMRDKSFKSLPAALKGRAMEPVEGELGHKGCVAFVLRPEKNAISPVENP